MRIAIITEKPYVASVVGPLAATVFPNDDVIFPVFLPVPQYGIPLPRGLSWKDYPHIAPFDLAAFSPRPSARFMLGQSQPRLGQFKNDVEMFEAALREADRWIVLCDGYKLFDIHAASLRLRGRAVSPQEVCPIAAWDPKTIQTALNSTGTSSQQLKDWISYGHVRRYFDHQFTINSLAILNRTLDHKGWISKYHIQMLYWLSQGGISSHHLYTQAQNWKGTGKYNDEVSLGSVISQPTIVSQLQDKGWVNESNKVVQLTDQGHQIIARLHPRCQDLDLPFRIHHWSTQGLESSQAPIDRYIRSFFGRQKRFFEAS